MSHNNVTIPSALQERALMPLPNNTRPTHCHIRNPQTESIEILTAIPTSLGGGQHGHTTIVCRPGTQDCATRAANAPPFVPPVDPGPHAIIPPGTNALDERNLRATCQGNQSSFDLCKMAITLVKLKLIVACGVCIVSLRTVVTGHTNVTLAGIFAIFVPIVVSSATTYLLPMRPK